MIFTKIYIDNLYCFKDTALDLTIPRQIKNSTIQEEFLLDRPNFRYKKVCILMGTNSSGKTSLGRLMLIAQHFICYKQINLEDIKEILSDKNKLGIMDIEYVTVGESIAHRLHLEFDNNDLVNFKYASTKIDKNDSNSKVRKKLEDIYTGKSKNYIENIHGVGDEKISGLEKFKKIDFDSMGWKYIFSENGEASNSLSDDKYYLSSTLMAKILKSFDSSIKSVVDSKSFNEETEEDELNGFFIRFHNNETLLIGLDGSLTSKERLSRGTFEAIQVASFIARILFDQPRAKNRGNVYFLDEKMAYVHSELEQSIINLIINKLPPYGQFFYTTHNMDILSLNIPIHSFCFLKKEECFSEFIDPTGSFKKNDRNLSNYVKNNFFLTLPDSSKIDSLLEDD